MKIQNILLILCIAISTPACLARGGGHSGGGHGGHGGGHGGHGFYGGRSGVGLGVGLGLGYAGSGYYDPYYYGSDYVDPYYTSGYGYPDTYGDPYYSGYSSGVVVGGARSEGAHQYQQRSTRSAGTHTGTRSTSTGGRTHRSR